MDIVQAEGLGDLLSAETEAQRRQAFDVLDGKLSKSAQAWKQSLMTALSLLEVSIDFSDEELPSDVLDNVHGLVSEVLRAIKTSLEGSSQAERLREGFEVAIVGPPNAGKSTLLNYLAGREAAITSARPGTTRDVIELSFDLDGIPVTFLDTAGLRSTDDEIEAIGVERALRRARNADVRIFLRSDSSDENFDDLIPAGDDLVLTAKSDLDATAGRAISGKTGDGVREMLSDLSAVLSGRIAGASLVAHERQRIALERAASALDLVVRRGGSIAFDPELASADIHSALNALDYLIGKFDIEAVFDLIFRNFCLGK